VELVERAQELAEAFGVETEALKERGQVQLQKPHARRASSHGVGRLDVQGPLDRVGGLEELDQRLLREVLEPPGPQRA
jgi:hypothetical protein